MKNLILFLLVFSLGYAYPINKLENVQSEIVKVYTVSNYFFMEVGDELRSAHSKDVLIIKTNQGATTYSIYFNNQEQHPSKIEYTDFRDNSDLAFATQEDFETWIYANTGFSTASGGSGVFSTGFLDYNDLATSTTPVNIIADDPFLKIPNDESGPNTNKSYPPSGVTDLWDVSTQEFDFSELNLGAIVHYRIDLTITTTQPNQEVQLQISLGQGGSPYSLNIYNNTFKVAGVKPIVFSNFIYIGDENTRNNTGFFSIKSDDNASMVVNGWALDITQRH